MELIQIIKKYSETRGETYFVEIAQAFRPLINSYAKKLYYLEYEDSVQELTIALYEALNKIKNTDNEFACLSYIKKSVVHRFCKLYYESVNAKASMDTRIDFDFTLSQTCNPISETDLAISNIDLEFFLNQFSGINRSLLIMLLHGYSDKEIAKKLGFSRQYINRIKKKLGIKLSDRKEDTSSIPYSL